MMEKMRAASGIPAESWLGLAILSAVTACAEFGKLATQWTGFTGVVVESVGVTRRQDWFN